MKIQLSNQPLAAKAFSLNTNKGNKIKVFKSPEMVFLKISTSNKNMKFSTQLLLMLSKTSILKMLQLT